MIYRLSGDMLSHMAITILKKKMMGDTHGVS